MYPTIILLIRIITIIDGMYYLALQPRGSYTELSVIHGLCFLYLAKCDLFSVRYCTVAITGQVSIFKVPEKPCLSGRIVDKNNFFGNTSLIKKTF